MASGSAKSLLIIAFSDLRKETLKSKLPVKDAISCDEREGHNHT
jgi:hypothetical protein